MFARYNYKAGSTLANVIADIVAILTGTTNVNSLSADCDTANSLILNTYANASWVVHDSAAGTNKQVLKGARFDDGTSYEYLMLDFNTSGYVIMLMYETWNATTHAGTNVSSAGSWSSTTIHQRLNLTAGGSMIIYANAGKCCFMQSNIPAGIGASNANEWTGVFQRSRLSPWDTAGAGYPLSVCTTGAKAFTQGNTSAACRYKNPAGGDVITTGAFLQTSMRGWGSNNTSTNGNVGSTTGSCVQTAKIPDGAGGFYTPLNDIRFDYQANQFLGGSISDVCDVWLGPRYPFNLDEVVCNGKTYGLFQNTNLSNNATNATANLAVPKG
ncbi:MAG: hypothetical protein ACOY4U_10620 [Pseudomonadota bacterium]